MTRAVLGTLAGAGWLVLPVMTVDAHDPVPVAPVGAVASAAAPDQDGTSAADLVLPLVAGVAAVALAGYGYARRTRRARTRTTPGTVSAHPPAPTPADSERQARAALRMADDCVRTSREELSFVSERFGEKQTEPFAHALRAAEAELSAAFAIWRRYEEGVPEEPSARRQALVGVIGRCAEAGRRLDAEAVALDQVRGFAATEEMTGGGAGAARDVAEGAADTAHDMTEGAAGTAQNVLDGTAGAAQEMNDGGGVRAAQDVHDGTARAAQDVDDGGVRAAQDVDGGTVHAAQDVDDGGVRATQDVHDGTARAAQDVDDGTAHAAQDMDGGGVRAALEVAEGRFRELAGRVVAAQHTLVALQERYLPSATGSVTGYVEQAKDRLWFATARLNEARQAADAGDSRRAARQLRAGEGAVAQAGVLVGGVERLAAQLRQAAELVPTVLAGAEARPAGARRGTQGSSLTPGEVHARLAHADGVLAAVREELSGGPYDPMDALRRISRAVERRDGAVPGARDTAALLVARSSVAAAEEFVVVHRGAVGTEARARLAESVRELAAGNAGRADVVAGEARELAERDVRAHGTPYAGAEGDTAGLAGAVLGGILLTEDLDGGPPATFGGPRTRSRHHA